MNGLPFVLSPGRADWVLLLVGVTVLDAADVVASPATVVCDDSVVWSVVLDSSLSLPCVLDVSEDEVLWIAVGREFDAVAVCMVVDTGPPTVTVVAET